MNEPWARASGAEVSYAEALQRAGGNKTKAAASLGITRHKLNRRLQGVGPPVYAGDGSQGFAPVLPGYEIKSTSAKIDGIWVRQGKKPGEEFATPDGHGVTGVSALVDADGKIIQQWVKTRSENDNVDAVAIIKSAFDEYKGRAEPQLAPYISDNSLLTVYNVADHHLGLYAYRRESGQDYDLKIGERLLLDTMSKLVATSPNAETAVILNLGDFFHADNSNNTTERSHNALDVDTRYAKVLQTGVKLLITCVELALAKHRRVIVRNLPGNHDPHSALALSVAMAAFFESNPRVEVDCDPSRFFFFQFGNVLIAATHGDMVKPDRIAGVVAAMRPEMWGATKFRYAYTGHIHHTSKRASEGGGMVMETFQTLAAKDAWHAAMGFVSGRSMVSITHHKEFGEFIRNTVSVLPE